jgi:hypothetical protein
MFGTWNFGHCYLFVIWDLEFGAFSSCFPGNPGNYASYL